MHKVLTSQFVTLLSGSCWIFVVKFVNQPDSCPSPWGISAPCDWLSQSQTTMARLTSRNLHRAATLRLRALKRSQIPILAVFRPLKPLGCYLTPGESNRGLNHSCTMISHEHFISWSAHRKTSRMRLLQCSPFRTPFALTMLHSFHLRVAMGFGSPHHYYPCLSV